MADKRWTRALALLMIALIADRVTILILKSYDIGIALFVIRFASLL